MKRRVHNLANGGGCTAGLLAFGLALALLSPAPAEAKPPRTLANKTTIDKDRPKKISVLRWRLRKARAMKQQRARMATKVSTPADKPCPGLDALSPRSGPRPFSVGEELAYELRVAGMYVGRFEIKVGKPRRLSGRNVLPLFGRARTNGLASQFQTFSGRYMALVDAQTLEPQGVRTESTYGKEARWERIRFSRDHRKVEADFLHRGRQGERSYDADHDLVDLLTMLYAARRFALPQGLEACQEVFAARRLWRMDAEVLGDTEVDSPVGKKKAIAVKAIFDRKPHRDFNNKNRPRVEIDVYFADDDTRAPLLFVIKTKKVQARGQLVRWSLTGGPEDEWAF